MIFIHTHPSIEDYECLRVLPSYDKPMGSIGTHKIHIFIGICSLYCPTRRTMISTILMVLSDNFEGLSCIAVLFYWLSGQLPAGWGDTPQISFKQGNNCSIIHSISLHNTLEIAFQ